MISKTKIAATSVTFALLSVPALADCELNIYNWCNYTIP